MLERLLVLDNRPAYRTGSSFFICQERHPAVKHRVPGEESQ